MRWDTRTDGRSQAFVEPARKAIALRPDDPRGWEQLAQFLTGAAHTTRPSLLASRVTQTRSPGSVKRLR